MIFNQRGSVSLVARHKIDRRAAGLALIAATFSGGWFHKGALAQSLGVPSRSGEEESPRDENILDRSVDEIVEQFKDAKSRLGSKGSEMSTSRDPIRFANGSIDLAAIDVERLAKIAQAMRDRELRDVRLSIEGHANATGSRQLNLTLTQQRADNVRSVLVRRYGVEASRLVAVGFGYGYPDPRYLSRDPRQRRAELRILAR